MAAIGCKWFMVPALMLASMLCFKQASSGTSKNGAPLPGGGAAPHPFFISVTEINHNAKDKILEISCKMFAEDLELQLEKNYRTTLDISLDKDRPAFDKYIPDYISHRLVLVVDGKPVKLSYIGFEKERESAYCYFQVNDITSLKKLHISNSILYDFNQDQINIIHVTENGKRQSTKLNYPAQETEFLF